jgi:hypothetical protein
LRDFDFDFALGFDFFAAALLPDLVEPFVRAVVLLARFAAVVI